MDWNEHPPAMNHHGRSRAPRTPERFTAPDCDTPSTPKPRLRIKRRHDPLHLAAPTQQFLASVAAADIPIPSIEEPAIADFESDAMPPWSDPHHVGARAPHERGLPLGLPLGLPPKRAFTPPKTPVPGEPPSLTPSQYPHWFIDWQSDCESSPEPASRPSTARSARTSRSSFSQLSSCFSDDEVQFSPDNFASQRSSCFSSDITQPDRLLAPAGMGRPPRKARWTPAMTAHLWATYNMYLSDARVTPFQISKSGLPPEGVCARVAREAARSWKGSKAVATAATATKPSPSPFAKSGSSTPTTTESTGAFMQWPHTGAATRAHLRALCKQKARGPGAGKMRFSNFSPSPTPFTNNMTAKWGRRSTTALPAFETHDLTKSLAMSTSESMHPEGPLARLTNSLSDSAMLSPRLHSNNNLPRPDVDAEPSPEERRRLGSPICAKSYGPSATSTLLNVFGLPAGAGQRQTRTFGPQRRLQSPVRLSRSSTQRRKRGLTHDARKRPGLSTDTWLDPSSEQYSPMHRKGFSLSRGEDHLHALASSPLPIMSTTARPATTEHATAPLAAPPRLGSPFPMAGFSSSVPNRCSQPSDLESSALERPFATMQPPRRAAVRTPEPGGGVNGLADRVAYVFQRLRDLSTPTRGRRSESPQ